jgi:hypothetical protein
MTELAEFDGLGEGVEVIEVAIGGHTVLLFCFNN